MYPLSPGEFYFSKERMPPKKNDPLSLDTTGVNLNEPRQTRSKTASPSPGAQKRGFEDSAPTAGHLQVPGKPGRPKLSPTSPSGAERQQTPELRVNDAPVPRSDQSAEAEPLTPSKRRKPNEENNPDNNDNNDLVMSDVNPGEPGPSYPDQGNTCQTDGNRPDGGKGKGALSNGKQPGGSKRNIEKPAKRNIEKPAKRIIEKPAKRIIEAEADEDEADEGEEDGTPTIYYPITGKPLIGKAKRERVTDAMVMAKLTEVQPGIISHDGVECQLLQRRLWGDVGVTYYIDLGFSTGVPFVLPFVGSELPQELKNWLNNSGVPETPCNKAAFDTKYEKTGQIGSTWRCTMEFYDPILDSHPMRIKVRRPKKDGGPITYCGNQAWIENIHVLPAQIAKARARYLEKYCSTIEPPPFDHKWLLKATGLRDDEGERICKYWGRRQEEVAMFLGINQSPEEITQVTVPDKPPTKLGKKILPRQNSVQTTIVDEPRTSKKGRVPTRTLDKPRKKSTTTNRSHQIEDPDTWKFVESISRDPDARRFAKLILDHSSAFKNAIADSTSATGTARVPRVS